MSLQQQPQASSPTNDQNRFIHLKAVDVDFVGARPDSRLEIKLKDESGFKHKSTVLKETDSLHWECDIYIKSLIASVLTIQKPYNFPRNRLVSEFHLTLNSAEVGDEAVEQTDPKSGITIKLCFGESKPDLDVTRLLADKAVSALATKVDMLHGLDRVLEFLKFVLEFGSDATKLNHAAGIAVPIVTAAFKRFQEIPACHKELVFIMNDLVSLLPLMKLALDHTTDAEVQGVLQTFLDLVKSLSKKLIEYSSPPRLDFLLRNWLKSKRDDVNTLKNQVLHSKLNVGLGLSVNIQVGVSEIQAGVPQIQMGITEVREDVAGNREAIAEIRQHQLSEADERTLQRLMPPKYCTYDPSRCCLPGTRASLLQDIDRWADTKHQSTRLYWIYGVAGCGKSSVAASVASALDSESRKLLSGSFFCKRDIPERRDPMRLLHALAYFLARASIRFCNALLRALKDDPLILDKALSVQYGTLLVGPLSEVSRSAHSGPYFIVVDALDECDENKTMFKYFTEMVCVAPWLRLIITSRPIQEISKGQQKSDELVLHDLFETDAYDDILSYIRVQFSSEGPLKELGAYISVVQVEALARKAWGLFIWIATVLKYVGGLLGGKLKEIEKIVSSAHAPNPEGELDALYLRVLNTVTGSSSDNQATVRMLVGLIFVTSRNRSLPSRALHAFFPSDLGVVPEEMESMLRKLGSVITTDLQTNAIRACHPSFLDFIGSQTRSGEFWMETAELDTMMAKKCFQLMNGGLKFNICNLESSYVPNSKVVNLEERVGRCISQELRYSCLYWLNHLSNSGLDLSEETTRRTLHNFLHQTISLYWLDVMSLVCELKTADSILQTLRDICKSDADLFRATSDLYRFIKAFHEAISLSTPHVYISALLWAPSESVIAKSLSPSFISQECVLQGRNMYWPVNLQTLLLKSGVRCVAYSRDGTRIVSGSLDKTVRIWDAQSGAQVGEPLQGHSGRVYSVAYSPDGTRIVSGADDSTIRTWDAESGIQVGEPLQGHRGLVYSVAYSPDGTRIVSGSLDNTIRIWDAESGIQGGEPLQGHSGWVNSVAYSPDGIRIVSGSTDQTVRIWDAESGIQVGEPLQGHSGWVNSVAYSPDGSRIVSGAGDYTIRIWDAESGIQVGEPLQGHSGWVNSVAYSPDGTRIVSGADDSTIRTWDAESGIQVGEPLQGHSLSVKSVAYSPDGICIVSGSFDKTVRIWDAESGIQVGKLLQRYRSSAQSVAYSPDGTRIVSGSLDNTIRIWDAESGIQVGEPLQGHSGRVNSVAYSPDRKRIVSGADGYTIRIWDAESGIQVGEPLQGHSGWVNSVAYSPDGKRIVSGAGDSTIRVWDAESGIQVGEPLQGHSGRVNSVAYSPDGIRIVSGADDYSIRIWDAESGIQVGEPLQGHSGWVNSVAYSPDGTRIVSGADDSTIRVWDAESDIQVGEPLQGHSLSVKSVAYSPDGICIVSGSFDKTVRIWDAESGIQIGEPLQGHGGRVYSVAYSPDGKRIVSGADDNTIRIWDAQGSTRVGEPLQSHGSGQCDLNAFSHDKKCFVSSSADGTIANVPELQSVIYSEVPLSVPNDGWIRTLDGELLLWIPHEYRRGVCDMSLACIPHNVDDHPVKIDWNKLLLGNEWTAVKIDN